MYKKVKKYICYKKIVNITEGIFYCDSVCVVNNG